MKTLLAITLSCFCLASLQADDERILMNAKVNGKPVRLVVDTGCGCSFGLCSSTAKKLHLPVMPPTPVKSIPPGQILVKWTKPQKVDLGFANVDTAFAIIDIPAYLTDEFDGFIGWPALTSNLLLIDCVTHSISRFTNASETFNGWVEGRILTNLDHLAFGLSAENHTTKVIALDSGCPYGVKLSPDGWQTWRGSYTNQPLTLEGYYTPNPGIVVSEEGWTDSILLGDLRITHVPVMQANSSDVALNASPDTEYLATLGLAAMKRLDIVIDGINSKIWLRPRTTKPPPYEHNRLGAAFVPADLKSDEYIAHVVNDSPAFEAGIRNGDILWKETERGTTHWWNSRAKVDKNTTYEDLPAGTKLDFTLNRSGKILKTTTTLRNILPPDVAGIPNQTLILNAQQKNPN